MLPDTTADMTPNVNDLSKTIHQSLCARYHKALGHVESYVFRS